MLYRFYAIIFYCFFISNTIFAQQKSVTENHVATVFYIGEDEKNYEKLVQKYNTMLFAVCNNNMELAFDYWSVLLKDIEDFSVKSNFDLKGVKLWLNVFWDKDGNIDHIVFYPKPNSRNLNYDNVKTLLTNFTKNYQSPIKYTTRFSHYGSAAFPVFSKSVVGPEK
jgi:5-methylcytosine-specific restriction endonuclease McrA